ncbi:MAG: MSMEG_4193 family putative phosphomutase [Acidimicrobiales bacterium]
MARASTTKKAATPKKAGSRKKGADAPKPTMVFLVRHGKTPTTGAVLPGRAKGLHLAPEGVAQAERAAERLAGLGSGRIDAVYASPMERTQETARPIAKALGLRVRTAKGLIEADFGQWTGRKLSELRKLPDWQTVQRYPSGFRFPGGESFLEMQTRMVDQIAELVAKHPGETIVATSHADTIKAAVAHAMGTHLDHFQRIVIGQCSITAILYTASGPVVLAVNSTGDDLTTLVPS